MQNFGSSQNTQRVVWFVLFPVAVVLLLGQDANWDLRNYHLYNPHAWWTGRDLLDIAPAQLQTWHNPTLDVPLYLFARGDLLGLASTLWLTLPTIAALFALDRLAPIDTTQRERLVWPALLSLSVLGGAAVLQEIGTSMNDTFVAAACAWALVLILEERGNAFYRNLLAGLLVGGVAGLKPTAAPFCIAIAVAVVAVGPLHTTVWRLAALAAGGVLGMAITLGPWAWETYQRFGNPLFPYFNNLLHSPWALPVAHADLRFRADGLGAAVAAPFQLLVSSQRFSESIIADPRLLASLVLFPWLAWKMRSSDTPTARRALTFFLFCAVGTLIWALLYGVYRYTMPMEMLGALVVSSMLIRFRWPLGLAGCIVLIAVTDHPKQARLPFNEPLLPDMVQGLSGKILVVTANDEPLAYAALSFADDVPWVSLRNNFMSPLRCTALQREGESRVYSFEGQVWLLAPKGAPEEEAMALLAEAYNLRASDQCREMQASAGDLRLCPLSREEMVRPCARPSADR